VCVPGVLTQKKPDAAVHSVTQWEYDRPEACLAHTGAPAATSEVATRRQDAPARSPASPNHSLRRRRPHVSTSARNWLSRALGDAGVEKCHACVSRRDASRHSSARSRARPAGRLRCGWRHDYPLAYRSTTGCSMPGLPPSPLPASIAAIGVGWPIAPGAASASALNCGPDASSVTSPPAPGGSSRSAFRDCSAATLDVPPSCGKPPTPRLRSRRRTGRSG
jgi:hypothetical protein